MRVGLEAGGFQFAIPLGEDFFLAALERGL